MSYSIIDPNLYLISLDQKMTGFHNFISAWLYKSDDIAFLVDPGPRYSINQLTGALKKIGVRRLDYILLTHIHIDHAGGTGALSAHYPEARIICHPRAVSHMVSSSRIIFLPGKPPVLYIAFTRASMPGRPHPPYSN